MDISDGHVEPSLSSKQIKSEAVHIINLGSSIGSEDVKAPPAQKKALRFDATIVALSHGRAQNMPGCPFASSSRCIFGLSGCVAFVVHEGSNFCAEPTMPIHLFKVRHR